MTELLRNAGPAGYLILFAGGLGLTLSLVTVILAVSRKTLRASVVLAGVLVGLGVSTLLLGAVGRITGRIATFRAVANVSPDDKQAIMDAGFAEANANTTLGLIAGAPLLVLGAAVTGAAFARQRSAS